MLRLLKLIRPATLREKVLLLATLGCIGVATGCLCAAAFNTDSGNLAEIVSAVATVVALAAAVLGYADNRQSQTLEHRAYLVITVDKVTIDYGKIKIKAIANNYGRTPASDIKIKVFARAIPFGSLEEHYNVSASDVVKGSAGFRKTHPNFSQWTWVQEFDPELSDQWIDHVAGNFARLSITLEAEYCDVFGDTQRDDFEYSFSGLRQNNAGEHILARTDRV